MGRGVSSKLGFLEWGKVLCTCTAVEKTYWVILLAEESLVVTVANVCGAIPCLDNYSAGFFMAANGVFSVGVDCQGDCHF